ncbi:C/D box methylation guide ribonucleoprotein complex aNOP56 subunit, partial [Candidatus Woesearchaeota archaeon]|nr:C/D box methylation guide ribonucleoprotein complex aNOP56 subunit [Candidatus Woesearchaeota archaeon]
LRKKNIELTRQAVKASVTRDLLIIQAVGAIEDTTTVANMLVNRLREWCGYYYPEFGEKTHANEEFAEKLLSVSKPKESMGADLEKDDIDAMLKLAKQAGSLYALKIELTGYLEKLMKEVCPNLDAVAGSFIGAKMISFAGSLKNLSEMPSSTVQLLGAEKALFRHLHGQGKSPKHGILVNHEMVKIAPMKEKGKVARALADKITIAVKVDYFKGEFIGDKLRKDLEKRFKR